MKLNKVNDFITDKIIDQLKDGNLKWLKDWSLGFGRNYISMKEYRGVNAILINLSLSVNNYKVNQWLTFNQIKQLKGVLNKGSKATPIIYFKVNKYCSCGKKGCTLYLTKNDAHKEINIPILRYYNVFNIGDTSIKPKDEGKPVNMPIAEVESKLNQYWDLSKIKIGNPAYSPGLDVIYMPDINNFKGTQGYYSVMTHELIHSTGHGARLKREGIIGDHKFGSDKYAYEELIAELGSAFLCARLGIVKDITNTSAYIKSWIKVLNEDKTAIFKASREGQEAQQLIMGSGEEDEDMEEIK